MLGEVLLFWFHSEFKFLTCFDVFCDLVILPHDPESREIPFFLIFKIVLFRSVLLQIDQKPQNNFYLQMFIISCLQTENIRNVIKLPTFFVFWLERSSK